MHALFMFVNTQLHVILIYCSELREKMIHLRLFRKQNIYISITVKNY